MVSQKIENMIQLYRKWIMGKSYSVDLRDRIADHIASGQSRCSESRYFGVRPSCAVKLALLDRSIRV